MRATVETPIGRMMMASDGEGLTELCLEDWWWATDHQAAVSYTHLTLPTTPYV